MKYKTDIIHWARENYKSWLSVVAFSLGLTFYCAPAQAAYRVHLDQPTLERGYTVALPNGKFSLGIPAQALLEPVVVSLKQPTQSVRVSELQLADQAWTLVGKVRIYNINLSQSASLTQPVWVNVRIPADQDQVYFLAFFDQGSNQWTVVPSTTHQPLGQITAALPFAYATLAVFSTPQLAPQEKIDFQSADSVLGSLQAPSAVVLDVESGQVLYSKNADEVRSIASMTKVITAYVALDYASDWSQLVTYSDAWAREGAALHILDGETLSVQDLLYTTIVGSANNTAVGLANVFTDQTTFLQNMNDWVADLGLTSTHLVEPSGLDPGNVSTAYEYALLSREALRSFSLLQLSTTKTYTLHLPLTGEHTIHTTDTLLYSDLFVTGGKTGYTKEAGYCLMIQTKDQDGNQIIVVVMGEPTSADRFTEAYALTQWAWDNYDWN